MADDTGAVVNAGAAGSSPAPNTASTPTPDSASSVAAPASSAPAPSEPSTAPAPNEPGPIPYARFKEVNDQLRQLRDWREQYGWVEEFQSSPLPYLEQWIDQVSGHPEMGPKLLAKAARMLAARRGLAAPAAGGDEPAPDIPILDAQGQPTGQMTYSAKQLKAWREWDWAQRDAAIQERLTPLEAMRTKLEHAELKAQIAERSTATAKQTLEELRQDPIFVQHEAAVKQALLDHEEWGDNVHRAFAYVLQTQVLPTRDQATEAKVLGDLKHKAIAGTVSPGVSSATQRPAFKSHKDALRYYAEHPAEAEAMANSR